MLYQVLSGYYICIFPSLPVMLLAQCFAIMPLTGIWQPNPRRTHFRIKSPQMIVTLIFMATSSILTLGMLKHLLKIGITARNMGKYIISNLACLLTFLSSFSGSSVLHLRAMCLHFVSESGTTLAFTYTQLDTCGTGVYQSTL